MTVKSRPQFRYNNKNKSQPNICIKKGLLQEENYEVLTARQLYFSEMLAAPKTNLITARAHKIKRSACMFAK